MNRTVMIAAAIVIGAGGLAYAVNKKPDQPAALFRSDRVLTAGGAPSGASSPSAAIATAPAGASLPDGEYTCYGSGLRILIGMGFRVSDGRYKDLDGNGDGTVAIAGDKVNFSGGHLDGQQGREVQPNGTFRIASMASCERTS